MIKNRCCNPITKKIFEKRRNSLERSFLLIIIIDAVGIYLGLLGTSLDTENYRLLRCEPPRLIRTAALNRILATWIEIIRPMFWFVFCNGHFNNGNSQENPHQEKYGFIFIRNPSLMFRNLPSITGVSQDW
ncbi:uncharacterized protein LOC135168906 [Diachasmimorpha longicaudata]|uniref:uncharacterized protein LOC135168906 n=1 Tax=Diachasmimorpha longicaudata TaxID=58733 RepID=UPI0030B8C3E6